MKHNSSVHVLTNYTCMNGNKLHIIEIYWMPLWRHFPRMKIRRHERVSAILMHLSCYQSRDFHCFLPFTWKALAWAERWTQHTQLGYGIIKQETSPSSVGKNISFWLQFIGFLTGFCIRLYQHGKTRCHLFGTYSNLFSISSPIKFAWQNTYAAMLVLHIRHLRGVS